MAFSSCDGTKFLAKEDLLYNGATLKTGEPLNEQPNAKLRSALEEKIHQQPNSKIFGRRFRLWVYEKNRNLKKEKGIRHWFKTKVGEAPVMYNESQTRQSQLLMEKHLRDNGFFNGEVAVDTVIKDQLVNVVYSVEGKGQFYVRSYILPPDTTQLLELFNIVDKKPKLRLGTPYRLSYIDEERARLKNLARKNGFYDFDQSAIYFYLDTAIQVPQFLDIYLTIKSPPKKDNYQVHHLGDATLYPDYKLNNQVLSNLEMDTIREPNWTMIQNKEIVKLKALKAAIAQDSGAVYSQELESQAINYLLDLGTFKFVNLRYQKDSIDGQPILNRYFYLTPNLNQDFGVELEASTERSNFLGSSVGVNYTHRNIFRGAEQFKTGLSLGVETQAGNAGPFINTLEASYSIGLTIPRLLLPFKAASRVQGVIPKTLINLKSAYQRRNTLFTSASMLLELGYTWKGNTYFQHQFYPFQFTYSRLIERSEEFNQELLDNPRLLASFDNLSILATNYRFTYSTQQLNTQKNFFYLKGEFETAGNLANLLARSLGNQSSNPYTLFNNPINQFARLLLESRYTYYRRKTTLVGRLQTGIALPYGNSEAVPYLRQFFVGGSNSLRAFRFRGVGPGSYSPDEDVDPTSALVFFDRVGDIKLEANVEYRFPLFSYLKGAFFVDAGNVWLIKDVENALPEGKFEWNRFYKEVAIGTGLGLRLDVDFVVIRLDVGIPLRDPSLPDQDRWIYQDIQFGNKTWRKENIKYNIAIGYPF